MLAASRPKPIGEPPKVLFITLVEDADHRLLNYFVLQHRDPQRPLLAVGLSNPVSLGGLRPVRSAVNPAVQIDESLLQPGLILLPRHPVYSRRGLPLQGVKAVPQ